MMRFFTKFNRRSFNRQGFSLVEVMLVMVIVGLLFSGLLIPIGALTVNDQYESEEGKLNTAHEAILGYAFSHRTVARIVVVSSSATNQRQFTLPAGRPYLPCPDITGDGYEDRVGFGIVGVIPGFEIPARLSVSASRNDLLVYGNCTVTRGVLPWRTLGIPPADVWGNRHTYEVDDVFSNAMVGFGQNAVIDQFDIRMPVTLVTGEIFYEKRQTNSTLTIALPPASEVLYVNQRRPIIVCIGDAGTTVAICEPGDFTFAEAGGSLAVTAFTAPRKRYQIEDAVEALPYVLVSHGKNGHGAVGHAANNLNVNTKMECNYPAYFRRAPAPAVVLDDEWSAELINFPIIANNILTSSARFCSPFGSRQTSGRFFHQPRVGELFQGVANVGYDDIVSWQTRQKLLNRMAAAGIFPVSDVPVLRPY